MAGKSITRAGRRVACAIDKLSKNTLADILLDRVLAEIGEDATDEQIVAHLQPWVDTVSRIREVAAPNLLGLMQKLDRSDIRFIKELERKRDAKQAKKEGG